MLWLPFFDILANLICSKLHCLTTSIALILRVCNINYILAEYVAGRRWCDCRPLAATSVLLLPSVIFSDLQNEYFSRAGRDTVLKKRQNVLNCDTAWRPCIHIIIEKWWVSGGNSNSINNTSQALAHNGLQNYSEILKMDLTNMANIYVIVKLPHFITLYTKTYSRKSSRNYKSNYLWKNIFTIRCNQHWICGSESFFMFNFFKYNSPPAIYTHFWCNIIALSEGLRFTITRQIIPFQVKKISFLKQVTNILAGNEKKSNFFN